MNLKKKILVISSDLEVGGIERSLLGLLGALDYGKYDVDLMLYRHQGDFMRYLPNGPLLLPLIPEYSTFMRPIKDILREGHLGITGARLCAKIATNIESRLYLHVEPGHLAFQKNWRYVLPFLPRLSGQYDVALSFVGPHQCVTERVDAKVKIGWVHTDYRAIPIDGKCEASMWGRLDRIAAVSEECRASFLSRFPQLADKTLVIENILSPDFVNKQALEFDASTEMPPQSGLTRILSVGRFSHAKGIDQAVLACRQLLNMGCNIRWYAVGYGSDEGMIRQLIAENGLEAQFIILGKKINPYPYIKACDLFVQPSRYEGKAVTVREAQMLGKPVLITRFPTAASQVEEGADGHICETGVEGIITGVQHMLSNPEYRARLATTVGGNDYGNQVEIEKIYSFL